MRTNHLLPFLLLFLSSCLPLSAQLQMTINGSQVSHTVSPLIQGHGLVYSEEADSIYNDGTMAQLYKDVGAGQVMSANDSSWSAFWSMGASRLDPADTSNISVGKHVGEDTNTTRANETIGYIVIEIGSGSINGVAYEAGLGTDTVRGPGNSATPYSYSLSGGLSSASAAAVSISGMAGNNGAWGVLVGDPAISASSISMYAIEDQVPDIERYHTTTQMCKAPSKILYTGDT